MGATRSGRDSQDEWYKVWIPGVGEGWVGKRGLTPVSPGTTYAVTVYKHEGKGFKVTDVETDVTDLTWNLKTLRDGSSYQVLMNYTGPVEVGREKQGLMTIHTNDAKYPTLKIPVHITVRERTLRPGRPSAKRKAPRPIKPVKLQPVKKEKVKGGS